MTKKYDQSYFEKWYHSRDRVHERGEVRRKVALAVTAAEYFLRRRLGNVLDVGCGEGGWFRHLRALRPRIEYTGIDSSEYAVDEYGASRNIRFGRFGDLPAIDLDGVFDLVVCSDVLHYVPDREIRRGVPALARLTNGIAFIEVLTAEDDIIGDLDGLIQRPASWYRNVLTRSGFTQAAPYCWLAPSMSDEAAGLEIPG